MKRSLFLTLAGLCLLAVAAFFNLFPETMLAGSDIAVNQWTVMFARTMGLFIGCFGLLSILSSHASDTTAMRAVLLVTGTMLLLTVGQDLLVRLSGTPVKNTASLVFRLVLAAGYFYYWNRSRQASTRYLLTR